MKRTEMKDSDFQQLLSSVREVGRIKRGEQKPAGKFEVRDAEQSPRFQALLDKSRASIQAGKGLSSRQFWDAVAQRHGEQARGKGTSRSRGPGRGAAAKGHKKREHA